MSRLKGTQIDVIIEYSAAEKNALITAKWDGPQLDMDSISDDPSYIVLKSAIGNFSYEREDAETDTNRIKVEISQRKE